MAKKLEKEKLDATMKIGAVTRAMIRTPKRKEYVEGLRKKAEDEKRAEEALARLRSVEESKKRAEEEKRMEETIKKQVEKVSANKIKKFIKEKNEKSRLTSVFKELDFPESTPKKKPTGKKKEFIDIGDGMSLAKKDPRGRKPLIPS